VSARTKALSIGALCLLAIAALQIALVIGCVVSNAPMPYLGPSLITTTILYIAMKLLTQWLGRQDRDAANETR
jgi:hypothetical protein